MGIMVNMTNVWVVAVLLFATVLQAPLTVDETFERLAKVEIFAFGPVGYAGTTSAGEKDYKAILSRPTALADFERLYSSGNVMAKAYALVGIRNFSPERFIALAQPMRNSKERITTMHGCIVSHESLGAIVKQIESGRYSRQQESTPE
jgi:hypothetical protein